MPERIEVVEIATGIVLQRFSGAALDRVGKDRLDGIKAQLQAFLAAHPYLWKYALTDLDAYRVDIDPALDDVKLRDNAPPR